MDKKIIIGVVVVAIIAVIAVVMMREPTEEQVVDPVDDIVDEIAFEVDETIDVEFCRTFITRAQLSEITGYEKDVFTFAFAEDVYLPYMILHNCVIKVREREITISHMAKPADFDGAIEKKEEIISMMEAFGMVIERKHDIGVGERSFGTVEKEVAADEADKTILFLDSETQKNIVVATPGLPWDTNLSLAKQVEANLR